jgi:MarR family 2-MHQ and catechol resistance regulon transcriptional repressor
MARALAQQALALDAALAQLVKKYQFRDRNEVVSHGLSVSQAYTLRALDDGDAMTMGELAASMGLSVSAMTRVVDPLEKRRLVVRVRSAEDRRICRVEMTKKGRDLWGRVHGGLVESEGEVLRQIPVRERERVIEVIDQLSQAIDEWRSRQ